MHRRYEGYYACGINSPNFTIDGTSKLLVEAIHCYTDSSTIQGCNKFVRQCYECDSTRYSYVFYYAGSLRRRILCFPCIVKINKSAQSEYKTTCTTIIAALDQIGIHKDIRFCIVTSIPYVGDIQYKENSLYLFFPSKIE